MNIDLKIHKCTEDKMKLLESKGVISRLTPGGHLLNVGHNESRHETIYASEERFGPHKLICVTINKDNYDRFLYHNENEEFLLLDRVESTPLIMLFALCSNEALELKIKNRSLGEEDFLVMEMVNNDPNLSFFTMNKRFAHVEMCHSISDQPPSFYVTESRDIDECFIDFKEYELRIIR